MIKIHKGHSPQELIDYNTTEYTSMATALDQDLNNYLSGVSSFSFTDKYKSDTVKKALIISHHNKCCFSEAKFNGDYSHVEHFRPKGRVDELVTNQRGYPGYYWLAYDWTNLFLCKSRINSSFKKNYFPLAIGSIRNRTHRDQNVEVSLIIDPSIENPRDYIIFHDDEPCPVDGRGVFNIKFLGLRHSEFSEARTTKFALLKNLRDSVDLLVANGIDMDNQVIKDSIAQLKSAMLPEAEFSSMAIDFLSGWPYIQ
jgi:hypothetical protein